MLKKDPAVPAGVQKMRRRQMLTTNASWITAVIFMLIIIEFFPDAFPLFLIAAGISLAIRAIMELARGHSTKRWIPVFQEVAEHEKAKLGAEWRKEKKTNALLQLLLVFVILFVNWDPETFAADQPTPYGIILPILVLVLIIQNVRDIRRHKKIDREPQAS